MIEVSKIVPVILCGDAGTRLWPVSRKSYTKQFSKLIDEKSLFQSAASICSRPELKMPLIITGDPFRFLVVEQLAAFEKHPTRILVKPESRNTAASVLAGVLSLHDPSPDGADNNP